MKQKRFRICYTAQDGSKTMIYDEDRFIIDLHGQVFENYGTDWQHPQWESPFDTAAPPILQQSTGCCDKNGKEIFEGDFVKTRQYDDWFDETGVEFIGEVFWYGASFRYGLPNTSGFSLFNEEQEFEVVGNIFETPQYKK